MMSVDGSDIIGALLRADDGGEPLAPDGQIKAGLMAANAPLPMIVVNGVSSVDRQPLKRGQLVRRTDRVAVSVRAGSHRERKALIAQIRRRCAGKTGNIGGGLNVSILTAGTGPEVNGPATSFERTQDFKVSFDAFD